MKRMITLALLIGAMTLSGCGGDATPTREVAVTMGPGMIFNPTELTGSVGEVLLVKVDNADPEVEHDMVVSGKRVRLQPGKTGQMIVSLKKAGTIDIRCTLPGHTEAGMVGTLKVVAQ